MRISEIFHSIQGEGINAGKDSVFVRFFGCNLACSWCDTKYAWHPKFAEYSDMTLFEILTEIQTYDSKHVIFTGGEPGLYQKDILDIIEGLPEEYTFEIESNGTIALDDIDDHFEVINISPKLSNSGNKTVVKAVNERYYYKFVVVDSSDIDEILELKSEYNLQKILLMPEGNTKQVQEERTPEIEKLCKKFGFQFSPRLHILRWNGEKGR